MASEMRSRNEGLNVCLPCTIYLKCYENTETAVARRPITSQRSKARWRQDNTGHNTNTDSSPTWGGFLY